MPPSNGLCCVLTLQRDADYMHNVSKPAFPLKILLCMTPGMHAYMVSLVERRYGVVGAAKSVLAPAKPALLV